MNQREAFEAWRQDNRPSCWHADWFTQMMQDLAWKSWQAATASKPKQEEVAHDAIELAAMIMSDCGISTINSSRLQAKIASRVTMYAAGYGVEK